MTWTDQVPVEPGFYWHRAPGEREQVCEVLSGYGRLYAAFPIGRGHYDWLALTPKLDDELPKGSEWFGPIPPPV